MEDTKDSLKIIAKGAIIVLFGIIFSKIITYLYRVIIARIGPGEYGTFSIALAIFGFITTISIMGLNEGLLRFIPHYRILSKNNIVRKIIFFCLGTTFCLGLFFSIILFYFSENIAIIIFHNHELSLLLKIISLAIPFNIINNILFYIFIAFKQVKYEVYLKNIIETSNKLILTFILVYIIGMGIFGVSIAYIIPIFITSILSLYILIKKILPPKTKSLDFFSKKEIFFYSFPLLLSTFLFLLLSWTDILMLGYFMPSKEVGVYNSAMPTAQLLYVIPYAFSILFLPILSELYAKSKKDSFKEIYQISNKWILMINFLIFSLFILFSKEILYYIFGKEYIVGNSIFIILSTGFFINYTLINPHLILKVIKKTKLIFWNSIVIAILNVLLNLLLIPLYGGIGAAIATGSSFILLTILVVIESIYFLKITPLSSKWINITSTMIFSFLIVLFLKNFFLRKTNFIGMLSLIIVFFFVYIVLLYISKSFQKEDIFIMKRIKEKIKTVIH